MGTILFTLCSLTSFVIKLIFSMAPGPAREALKVHGREWAIAAADVETVLDRYASLYTELVAAPWARTRRRGDAPGRPTLERRVPPPSSSAHLI